MNNPLLLKMKLQTGTGFIAIESMKGKSFSLEPDSATDYHGSCKGNPATNEWIPAAADEVVTTFILNKLLLNYIHFPFGIPDKMPSDFTFVDCRFQAGFVSDKPKRSDN